MVALARTEHRLVVTADTLDTNKFLFNVATGTLDLEIGELRPHDPTDYITKLAPVEYDPSAECPVFDEFLARIMDDRREVIDYLRRAVGHTLTGDISERAIFILHGSGRNGKSTLLEVLRYLFGDYGSRTSMDTIVHKKSEGENRGIVKLIGSRFASEAEEGKRLNTALMKELTGDELITARPLYQELQDFLPEFKIWLATNHRPSLSGDDQAAWDRIHLIPFDVRIPEDEVDKLLKLKMRVELPGILAWAVRGAVEWQERGLDAPDEVRAATAGYREEMDSFGAWLEERTVTVAEARTKSSILHADYCAWSVERGEKPVGTVRFSARLKERGFEKVRDDGMKWVGIGLATSSTEGRNPTEPISQTSPIEPFMGEKAEIPS